MRIQDKLGEINAADQIKEDLWAKVMQELNNISMDCAKEMQAETGAVYSKPERDGKPAYTLNLFEAPPTRLLALQLILATWVGWVMHEKHPDEAHIYSSNNCWKMIEKAYRYGVDLSISKKKGDKPVV